MVFAYCIFFFQIRVNALIKRGGIFIQQEKQTEGLADFAQAARIDQDNSDIYHHRGHVRLFYTVKTLYRDILYNSKILNNVNCFCTNVPV